MSACNATQPKVEAHTQPSSHEPSVITVSDTVLHTGVTPFGINLSGQTYYDSGQMLANLVFRNPGFEGGTWQSILRCKAVAANSCTDENQYSVWPAGFLDGATLEVLSGAAEGESGKVTASTAAHAPLGVTLQFTGLSKPLAAGDFILVRIDKPGNATAGWWTSTNGGASFTAERADLSPDSPGKQALRVNASGAGQSATVTSYFDSLAGHSFVHLHGKYRVTFRAKPVTGPAQLNVEVQRLDAARGPQLYLHRDVALARGWHNYTLDFDASETASAVGTLSLTFAMHSASVLLDDVALTSATHAADNPTAFRDEVVQALRELHPGMLRYMDNGTDFGSSLDNMLAPPFARLRAGASTQQTVQEDIPIGLHEFLVLCKAIGADPWFTMPPGTSPTEMQHLIEYLSAPAATLYGGRRASLGQSQPWTEVFKVIHLELGNEQWNAGSFAGATMADPTAYGHRAQIIFSTARRSPYFASHHFDLVLGTWAAVPWWTGKELAAVSTADSTAIAPYLFTSFNDASNNEAVFGPMFAQPEQIDSRSDGLLRQQLQAARQAAHPVNLAVYEVNLGTIEGTATQASLDATVPSMGAGLAVADHMLLMLRDLGITTQALFALPEFENNFASGGEKTPIWGAVVDMGGATNRRRPQFLALQMINHAILPQMLHSAVGGANPTWEEPLSANDHIQLRGAHLLQSFAFADGARRSLIVLNLSRTNALPVTFAGSSAPTGRVQQTVLTSVHITDNNELREQVKPETSVILRFDPSQSRMLPPFSMTVLTWTQPH